MEYQIVKASTVAKKAIRRANKKRSNCPQIKQQKKFAMRQYRKMINSQKPSEVKLDQDYSKYIEWAILATVILAVISVSHPQIGILAIIFSILIVAAIIDTKIKSMNKKNKQETQEKLDKLMRYVKNEKINNAIEVKSKKKLNIVKKGMEKIEAYELTGSSCVTEFPYKGVQ